MRPTEARGEVAKLLLGGESARQIPRQLFCDVSQLAALLGQMPQQRDGGPRLAPGDERLSLGLVLQLGPQICLVHVLTNR